jgi:hypothetical protein
MVMTKTCLGSIHQPTGTLADKERKKMIARANGRNHPSTHPSQTAHPGGPRLPVYVGGSHCSIVERSHGPPVPFPRLHVSASHFRKTIGSTSRTTQQPLVPLEPIRSENGPKLLAWPTWVTSTNASRKVRHFTSSNPPSRWSMMGVIATLPGLMQNRPCTSINDIVRSTGPLYRGTPHRCARPGIVLRRLLGEVRTLHVVPCLSSKLLAAIVALRGSTRCPSVTPVLPVHETKRRREYLRSRFFPSSQSRNYFSSTPEHGLWSSVYLAGVIVITRSRPTTSHRYVVVKRHWEAVATTTSHVKHCARAPPRLVCSEPISSRLSSSGQ